MPLKQCCATGSLHAGTPTGRIRKVHGLDCYIADAPNGAPKGVVVIIPDAFGWELPNNRILADCYAKEGNFQVYLPEFMDGISQPQGDATEPIIVADAFRRCRTARRCDDLVRHLSYRFIWTTLLTSRNLASRLCPPQASGTSS